MPPLSFDDVDIRDIRSLAAPIWPASRRSEYLRAVVRELGKHQAIGGGTVGRVARELQRRFLAEPGKRRGLAATKLTDGEHRQTQP